MLLWVVTGMCLLQIQTFAFIPLIMSLNKKVVQQHLWRRTYENCSLFCKIAGNMNNFWQLFDFGAEV